MITICTFFSFISNGRGDIRYFNAEQRRNGVAIPDGGKVEYDSHTSIATFYGIIGAEEDKWNKFEWNPFTEVLKLDTLNTTDDSEAVLATLKAIDWHDLCGDIENIKSLMAQIPLIPWLKNNGVCPDGIKLFETRDAAWDAARDAARDAAWAAAWDAARDAAWDAARDAARDAAWAAARDAAGDAARDAAWAAALLARLHVCDGLEIDHRHMEHAKLRWSVWEAGYGVLCDVDGVIYAYKRI